MIGERETLLEREKRERVQTMRDRQVELEKAMAAAHKVFQIATMEDDTVADAALAALPNVVPMVRAARAEVRAARVALLTTEHELDKERRNRAEDERVTAVLEDGA